VYIYGTLLVFEKAMVAVLSQSQLSFWYRADHFRFYPCRQVKVPEDGTIQKGVPCPNKRNLNLENKKEKRVRDAGKFDDNLQGRVNAGYDSERQFCAREEQP
jgi:hypothetical protein